MNSIVRLIAIAKNAGEIILTYYQSDFEKEQKSDDTPVTTADIQANNYIVENLQKYFPQVPIIAEESALVSFDIRKNWDRYFLVDPLDGTKEFIAGNGQFTVNIALRGQGEELAVVWTPVSEELFYFDGKKSFKQVGEKTIELTMQEIHRPLRVAISRSHLNRKTREYIESLPFSVENVGIGSSLKFCRIAEGEIDFYPRFGPIKEWDVAAAELVLLGAGGEMRHLDGQKIQYNKESMMVPSFVACKSSLLSQMI